MENLEIDCYTAVNVEKHFFFLNEKYFQKSL